ncbi:peroxidase [Cytidiella melzeri]|nr:peroxidase [Cytidiella melzeri]
MHLKQLLAASAALLAISQPSLAYSLRRAATKTPRTTPILGSFPGQGPLPIISQATLQSAGTVDGLPVDNIQGDIFVGMRKLQERFLFFQVNNATAFKSVLRTYAVANITSAAQLLAEPSSQPLTFVNVGFSQTGATALGVTDDLGDSFFSAGQFADAESLGDDTSIWEDVFKGTSIHGVFLLGSSEASSTLSALKIHVLTSFQASFIAEYESDLETLFGSSWTVLYALSAAARPGAEAGHEHFGFVDGISNPALDGFGTPLPGQAVVDPGVILTGESGDATTRPSWALDGSFMVFRKLQQLVPEFNKWTLDNALQNNASTLTVQEGADLLGARMFGRWKSGAPTDLAPEVDDPTLGADPERNNNFNFTHPGSDLTSDQSYCPFSAHIRKTNPRADLFGLDTALHAIRAGTPYGPEVTDAESSSNVSTIDRGLAFVEYQSIIANGFRRQQAIWANAPAFPPDKTLNAGLDAIIGQGSARISVGLNEDNQTESYSVATFVVPTGGEYFFLPSISAVIGTFAA